MSFIFKKEELEKIILHVDYILGVDMYDDDIHAYCLIMRYRETESDFVILSKEMKAGDEFNQEVENLRKYFNARLLRWN